VARGSKRFFLKKEAKTFIPQEQKFFGSFFKKEPLPS
jgi:hypothetical protein